MIRRDEPLSLVIVGASGDLARKKIYPALFALYCRNLLPEDFLIFGFARSALAESEFRQRITEHLACRYTPGESCAARMAEFLERCHYMQGEYGSVDSYLDLYTAMHAREGRTGRNRLFYLSIPPSIFLQVAHTLGASGMVYCGSTHPWSRVVLEKPFGRDRASSDELSREIGKVFPEPSIFRIDHYLGKEVIQNLMVLRFANRIFEPLWNSRYIRDVQIDWKEDIGVEGRGGYFDAYGIVRDVVQNHLLQILSLVAMEAPHRLASEAIRKEKARVLRAVPPPACDDLLLGQYIAAERGGVRLPGYRDDPTVAPGSLTPTYAAVTLRVENERWAGVPFIIRAGKALDGRATEIRIRFRDAPDGLFAAHAGSPIPNELLIRVQPDESIRLRIASKVPGPGLDLAPRTLDLSYKSAFSETIPDAYESLLLDVIRGERSLFISEEELEAAWDIFTPALHEIENRQVRPDDYPFGSGGPARLPDWSRKHFTEVAA